MRWLPLPGSGLRGSRLALRLTLLVLTFALAPILILGILTYLQVTDQLRQQVERRLYQETKATAMSISERLLFVDAGLEALTAELSRSADASWSIETGLGRLDRRQIGAIVLERWDGRLTLHGGVSEIPALDRAGRGHLADGRMLLRATGRGDPLARLWAARALDPGDLAGGILWARIEPTYLWGIGPDSTLPPLAELAVLDDFGFLVRADAVPEDLASRLRSPTADTDALGLRWRAADGAVYLAARWTLPMATNYAAGVWTLSISRHRGDVLAPLAGFRRTFPQLVLLSALLVLLVGTRSIRRTLQPLPALQAATRRIARGDFSQQVKVESGDELEDLADAFNRMADVVGTQLATTETMAAVGRSALTDAASDRIVDILLARIDGILKVDTVRVILADDAEGWRSTTRSADGSRTVGTEPAPPPQADEPHRLTAPIDTERRAFGFVSVERQPPRAFDAAERETLEELADHLALALDHLDLRAALDSERRRLGQLVEELPNGVVVLDADGFVRLANRLGRSFLSALAPSIDGRVDSVGGRSLALLAESGEARWHEVELSGPPRRIFIVSVIREPAARPGGGAVVVLREITAEREAEDRARRDERLATVGRLAAGISHDFNNLLTGIMMATDLLHQASPSRETGLILDQCRRASDMIGRILDFTRASPHRPTELDVAPVVESSVRLIAGTLPDNVELELDIAPSPLWARADATQIQQVVDNLTVNARDAMHPDGGRLTVSLGPVEEGARPDDAHDRPWLRLAVADTGPGIPPNVRPHVFDPFFTTKELGAGTGLGLAQVLGLVAQHGGRVDVETGHDGTTFEILLPAQQPPPTGDDPEPEAGRRGDRREQWVLVVDDDPAVLRLVEHGLGQHGYRVQTAPGGREALDAFAGGRAQVDLVISDVRMPELDGFELLRRLRAIRPDLPVLLMSGHVDPQDDGADRPSHAWLQKPFSIQQLSQAVAQALASPEDSPS